MFLLKWSILFLLLAAVAAIFGFGNVAEGFTDIAKILFGIFAFIVVIMLILGLTVYKTAT